jgi:hypothetical protein
VICNLVPYLIYFLFLWFVKYIIAFIKGGFKSPPFGKGGFRVIWFFTVKPAATMHGIFARGSAVLQLWQTFHAIVYGVVATLDVRV